MTDCGTDTFGWMDSLQVVLIVNSGDGCTGFWFQSAAVSRTIAPESR